MKILDIINMALKHNKLVVMFTKGELWFADPNISQAEKDKTEPKYKKLLDEICKSYNDLEDMNVELSDSMGFIELPNELKRKDVEIWFEDWMKYREKKHLITG